MSNLARVRDVVPSEQGQLDGIQDIPLFLKVMLARGTISLRKLTELKVGDVLPLPKAVGESLDLYAGDVIIGSVEALAMDGVMVVQISAFCDKPSDLPEQES